jgi:serine/threonine protein kinase
VDDSPDTKAELAAIHSICRSEPRNAHVIRVDDFWIHSNVEESVYRTFIKMERCEGTLEQYLASRHDNIKPLELVDIMVQMLSGLAHCHMQGFCHRDLNLKNGISNA